MIETEFEPADIADVLQVVFKTHDDESPMFDSVIYLQNELHKPPFNVSFDTHEEWLNKIISRSLSETFGWMTGNPGKSVRNIGRLVEYGVNFDIIQ